jgi:hypothetical protein
MRCFAPARRGRTCRADIAAIDLSSAIPDLVEEWKIERLFAWLFRSRRLVTRDENKAEYYLGFVQLACAKVLWSRL